MTFTATVTPVSGSNETGTVDFDIDGFDVSGPVSLSGNTASYTTSWLAIGNHTITATYSGDSDFAGGISPTLNVDIGDAIPFALTTPATVVTINQGDSYTIDWIGGNATDTVQLWAEGGPNNTPIELTTGVPESDGSYTWDTTGVMHGWYYFQAMDFPNNLDAEVAPAAQSSNGMVYSPNWLHIVSPDAAAPNVSLNNPPFSTDSVAQGDSYTLNFTASNGSGDTNPIYVQLWVFSGNTGQWTQLPSADDLPVSPGSYAWDTTGMAPGWYCFAAHACNGDQWAYNHSPGWLDITVPTPTITYLTATGGETVTPGSTFNLQWNITGLSAADYANATVKIWEQLLGSGVPQWTQIADNLSDASGAYNWTVPTSPGAGNYYAFSIWLDDGDQQWGQASPNWVQVT